MHIIAAISGVLVVLFVLLDAFETVILPRRVNRRLRLTNLFFVIAWTPYRKFAKALKRQSSRDTVLAYFGPAMILVLLVCWAGGILIGFALMHWGLGSHIRQASGSRSLPSDLYFSGTTFFTLGLGDLVPVTAAERALTVAEAGVGLGFLAIVISYIPVLYQSFSQREVFVNRLTILTGCPPTPGAILSRYALYSPSELRALLDDWQIWTAELMDSMQSFPVLSHYRSQHTGQSWLTALTAILDTSALICHDPESIFEEGRPSAQLAFTLAAHASRDICSVLGLKVPPGIEERPDGTHHEHLLGWLTQRGLDENALSSALESIDLFREKYESFIVAMSEGLLSPVPAFCPICQPEPHFVM